MQIIFFNEPFKDKNIENNNIENNKKIYSDQHITFIHIGKCGGTTVSSFLKKYLINYNEIHTRKPNYNPNTKYIIWLRDPISRFISAFNMSYDIINNNSLLGGKHIYVNNKFDPNKWDSEYINLINYFKTPNNLAEALNIEHPDYNNAMKLLSFTKLKTGFQHISAGISWYLSDKFLNDAKDNIIFIGRQENLSNDIEKLRLVLQQYNINLPKDYVLENKRIANKYNKTLLNKAMINLNEYLKKDYEIINTLEQINYNKYTKKFSNKFNTYVLMYGYNYEKQLAEFLTYYLHILEFDYVIFVEDFKTQEDYNENSIMKNICGFFGDRVIYDYLIRDEIDTYQKNRLCTKDDRDCFQYYITEYWSSKLKDSIENWSSTWLLYVNGDEFLNLNKMSINTFLNKYSKDYKGISFKQHLFGDNGVEEHKYDSLIIDTHRNSVPAVYWSSKTLTKEGKQKWNNWPSGPRWRAGDPKGFKSMYRLDAIDMGWMHRIMHLDSVILSPKIEEVHLNHYMIIDKKNIFNHFVNRQDMRYYVNIDLNNEGKPYTNLWEESDKIKSNSSYIQAIDYLSTIYDQSQVVEGFNSNEKYGNEYIHEYFESNINNQRYVFIHIGKSGGTTIRKTMKKFNIKITQIHLEQVIYQPNTKYIIWLRDPLTRFVSAYNFASDFINNNDNINEIIKSEGKRFIDLVNYFNNSNELAENIYKDKLAYELMSYSNYDKCNIRCSNHINHINKGIAYYLNNGQFIKNYHKDIFVGTLENIENDINTLQKKLGITELGEINSQKWDKIKTNKSKYLSPLAKQNLKKFYEKDYYCIELFIHYGLIDYDKVKSYFE